MEELLTLKVTSSSRMDKDNCYEMYMRYIEENALNNKYGDWFSFVLDEVKDTNIVIFFYLNDTPIGFAEIIEKDNNMAVISIFEIAKNFRGKGYGTRAFKMLMGFLSNKVQISWDNIEPLRTIEQENHWYSIIKSMGYTEIEAEFEDDKYIVRHFERLV